MTYAWLSLAFLAVSLLVALAAVLQVRRGHVRTGDGRSILPIATAAGVLCTLVLFALTSVFDNVMIAVGLMTYSARHITGLRIGAAPLEDFAYPLAAVMLLPSLWLLFAKPSKGRR